MSDNLYKKRIPFVDVTQVTSDNIKAAAWWCGGVISDGVSIDVVTQSGTVNAVIGDHIVKDKNGHCSVYIYDPRTRTMNAKKGIK